MVMSQDHNAGRIYSTKIHNGTFERVEKFRYLGTTLTNRNSIQEIIQCRMNSVNLSYHSVQNLSSSTLLSIYLNIKKYINIILPVVLYGCETWLFTLREERRVRMFENRVLRRISREHWGMGPSDVTGHVM